MTGRSPQCNSIMPPKGAAVQFGDPLPDLAAQTLVEQLGDNPSDASLAETIALTCEKVGHLMHLVEEGEASEDELDEWLVLEKRLCHRALETLARNGIAAGKGSGLMGAISPFMVRNGYVDACGWWVRCDECPGSDKAGLCPECGAPLEGFVEGSSMGQRCPNCEWAIVRTYAPPIVEDEQKYTIVVAPGGTPTRKALRVVSRIAMCNYIAAKRLMEDAPAAIFAGRATEVLTRKNDLEEAGVPIEVQPNFPYDKDGKLMGEVKLNGLLLESFPELIDKFKEYTSWQDGMETGCFLTYEDLLLPLARHALDNHDEAFLTRLGAFVERLMTSGDDHAVNVATVGLIEGLKAYGSLLVRSYLGPVSLEEFDTLIY